MSVAAHHPMRTDKPGWLALRVGVLIRARHCCEACGAPNGSYRRPVHDPEPEDGLAAPSVRVVLTIAHLCRCEPPCMDLEHVKALCQRCHLRLDARLHARHAAQTRRRKLDSARPILALAEREAE